MPSLHLAFLVTVGAVGITSAFKAAPPHRVADIDTTSVLFGRQAIQVTTVIDITTVTIQGSTVTVDGGTVTITAGETVGTAFSASSSVSTGFTAVETVTIPASSMPNASVATVATVAVSTPTTQAPNNSVTTVPVLPSTGVETTMDIGTLATIETVGTPTIGISGGFSSGILTILTNNGTLSVSMTPTTAPTSDTGSGESGSNSGHSDADASSSSSRNAGAMETGVSIRRGAVGLAVAFLLPAVAF